MRSLHQKTQNKYSIPKVLAASRLKYWLHAVFFILLSVLVKHGISSAAVMPEFNRLSSLTDSVKGPMAVALDSEGRLFVADNTSCKINIFSQSGRNISFFTSLDNPISVAVDDSGKILVGSKENGSVAVYATDFTPLFKLGNGTGEFSWPNDIGVDTTGRIYVVDRGNDIVRVYDSSGNNIGTIGEPGNNNGQFHRPLSVAVDETAGEIIVLDRQIIPGTSKLGARIQFFTMEGNFLRGFTRNSTQEGGMVIPQGITVDSASRIYVTDSYQNAVLVYDNTGIFLGAIFDPDIPLRAPLGLTIGKTNRLYVASRMAGSIDVYGIDQYSGMLVDPASLTFTTKEGGTPASRGIAVKNTGTINLNWGAVTNEDWLIIADDNGILEPGQTATVEVAVNVEGFVPGDYTGSVVVSADSGATETVQVVLSVEPTAILSVKSAGLDFITETGTAPAPGSITISNTGSATLSWSATADQPWIDLSESEGILTDSSASPVTIAVTADVITLAAGTYNGTITIEGNNALGNPVTIDVRLTLSEPAVSEPLTPAERILDNMTWEARETVPPIILNGVWTGSGSQIYAVGQGGTILHYDGKQWSVMDSGTGQDLYGVWGSLDTEGNTIDVFAVGAVGTILHYDGTDDDWTVMKDSGYDLNAVWGTSINDVYAVGKSGTILHYDGSWNSLSSPTTKDLYGIWGSSAIDIYAIGQRGTIVHYDGASWIETESPAKNNLYGIWGASENDVYIAGQRGTLVRGNGNNWNILDSVTRSDLYGIWGNSESDIYAAGEAGTILHYNGTVWNAMRSPVARELRSVSGSWETGVYAVGQDLTLLRYDYSNWNLVILISSAEDLYDVWGASATDIFAVGLAGSIIHYDGEKWTPVDSPSATDLYGISGNSTKEIYAVGTAGTVIRYAAGTWTPVLPSPTDKTLYDVWVSSGPDAFAAGQRGAILHYDGETWTTLKSKSKNDIYGIWGRSATDVFMVGQEGDILHYDGEQVSTMQSSTENTLYAIWGCGDNTLYAAGQNGTFLLYQEDTGWVSLDSGISDDLFGIWCSSATDVFAVGQHGTILYFDGEVVQKVDTGTDGWLKNIWGSTITTDVFAVGANGIIYYGQQ